MLSSEPPRRRPCARRAFLRAGANDDDLEAISAATDARGGRRRRLAFRRDRRDAIAATRPSLAANRTEPNRAEPTTPILSQAVLLEQSEGTSDSARLETAGRSARDRITRLLGALVLRMEVPKGAVGCLCRGVGRASARGGARGWSDVLGSAARGVGATHHRGAATETYPLNPNGSPLGITGTTTADGRFTVVMPHPERVFRTVEMSWHPDGWGEDSPWMRLFRNARLWVG